MCIMCTAYDCSDRSGWLRTARNRRGGLLPAADGRHSDLVTVSDIGPGRPSSGLGLVGQAPSRTTPTDTGVMPASDVCLSNKETQ